MVTDYSTLALQHTKNMETNYSAEIAYSIHESEIFRDDQNFRNRLLQIKEPNLLSSENKLLNIDTVGAIFLPEVQKAIAEGRKVAVLNFAAFKNPGGKFLEGSTAQEECLCFNSYLYNVLEAFYTKYYLPNQKNTNRGLYNNSALYCAGIRFWNNGPNPNFVRPIDKNANSTIVDVITCAAPNKSGAKSYYDVPSAEIAKTFKDRIIFLKDICKIKQVDILIAGAWGCGVFGNDPRFVALNFKEIFENSQYPNLIIHPVPNIGGRMTNNFLNFNRVFPNLIENTEKNTSKEWH